MNENSLEKYSWNGRTLYVFILLADNSGSTTGGGSIQHEKPAAPSPGSILPLALGLGVGLGGLIIIIAAVLLVCFLRKSGKFTKNEDIPMKDDVHSTIRSTTLTITSAKSTDNLLTSKKSARSFNDSGREKRLHGDHVICCAIFLLEKWHNTSHDLHAISFKGVFN